MELHIRKICQEIQDLYINKEDDGEEGLKNIMDDEGMHNLENMLEY